MRATAREKTSHVAIVTAINEIDRFVDRFQMNQAHHRPKDLGLHQFTIDRNVFQDRRRDKMPFLVA